MKSTLLIVLFSMLSFTACKNVNRDEANSALESSGPGEELSPRSVINFVGQQAVLFKNDSEKKEFDTLYEWAASDDLDRTIDEAVMKSRNSTQAGGTVESIRKAIGKGLGVVVGFLAESTVKNPLLGAIGKRLYPKSDLKRAQANFRVTSGEVQAYLSALITGKVGLPDVWRRMQKLGVNPISFTSKVSKLSEKKVQELDQGNLKLVADSEENLSLSGGTLLNYSPSTMWGAIGALLVLVGMVLGFATLFSAGADPTGHGSAALALSFIVVSVLGFAGMFIDFIASTQMG